MYVVIVGAGRIGLPLAHWIVTAEHELAVIDNQPDRCAAADDALGSVSVLGDSTEAEVLAKSGANRADVLIAMTGSDEVNLVSCQLAKHRFGVPRTIALVNNPEREKLFTLLGISVAVNTTELIVNSIQAQMAGLLVESLGERQ